MSSPSTTISPRRDADWMGQIYRFLGLTVGVIVPNLTDQQRRDAYDCDITYGTNNEFGFDYLRDNMKYERAADGPAAVQFRDRRRGRLDPDRRGAHAADHLRPDRRQVRALHRGRRDREAASAEPITRWTRSRQSVVLTEDGTEKVERLLEDAGLLEGANLYDIENTQVVHHLNQALKANVVFKRDIDYIVKDGKVVIIDEFTGRMMDGRRWSDGLHQAVEAKEGVEIEPENQTLASITFQNYFRMYPKLSGMTGTAATEAPEFYEIYKMNVVSIPTNVPVQRIDEDDEFYKNMQRQVRRDRQGDPREAGRPASRCWSAPSRSRNRRCCPNILKQRRIKHQVLNARFHEQEAHIVAQAGRLGAVTIATNMAGRGTDIQLGGNLEFRMHDELADLEPGTPEYDAAAERIKRGDRRGEGSGCSPPAACSCSAPSGTRAAASTTSCAAVRAARAIPACRRFYLSARRRSAAHLRPADDVREDDEQESGRWRGDRLALDLQGDRDRAEEGRGAQLRHPQAGRRI